MGDFNARIGSNASIIQSNAGLRVFNRTVEDAKGGGNCEARTRGIQLVDSMNSVGMVIMNGIDAGGQFTYRHYDEKRMSMNDYIILSDNIVIPSIYCNNLPVAR